MRFFLYSFVAIFFVLVIGTNAFADDTFDEAAKGLASESADESKQDYFGKMNPNDIEICNEGSVDMGEWNGVSLKYIKECGWTVRAVSLVRAYLLKATEKWLDNDVGNDDFLNAYVAIIFLLALTLHGVQMTAGALRNPLGDTFGLILKMAVASYFVFNMDKYGHIPFVLLDFLITLPSKVLDVILDETGILQGSVWGTDGKGLTCIYIPEDSYHLSLWMRIDCLMSRFVGIALTGVTVAGGLWLLVFVFLFTSIFMPIAGYIFVTIVSIVLFCIGAYLKAVVTYIKALLNIMVLLAVSVIFIPFVVLPDAVMGGKGGALGNLIKQMLDSIIVPFLMYTYMSFFVVIVALSYQDLYLSFVQTDGNATIMDVADGVTYTKTLFSIETCTPFGQGDWSTVSGALKKAGSTAVDVLDTAVGVDLNFPCFVEGAGEVVGDIAGAAVNYMKGIAISATVLFLVTYLMYVYYRYFISLTTVIAGQFDLDLVSSAGIGKYIKKAMNSAKSAFKAASGDAAGAAADTAKEAAKTAAENVSEGQ